MTFEQDRVEKLFLKGKSYKLCKWRKKSRTRGWNRTRVKNIRKRKKRERLEEVKKRVNDKENDIEKQVWTIESEAPFHRGVYLRLPTIFSILFLRPGHVSFDDTRSTFIFFFLGSINLETSYREMTNTYGWIDSFIRRDLSITINFFSTFSIFVETDRNRHISRYLERQIAARIDIDLWLAW